MKTILTKIKSKSLLFENIQGYVGIRHYILPYLINEDKILQNKLKVLNGIAKNNQLSSNFTKNFFTFISDRILFRIINEDKTFMDESLYLPEDKIYNFQKIKKRLFAIYKSGKYNKTNININDLKIYLPNDRELALFLFDFLVFNNSYNKLNHFSQIYSIFPKGNLKDKSDINKFFRYYDQNKILFENEEKINQLSVSEIESTYYKLDRKVLINLAFIGNLKSGKSTTIGHLLYSTGFIDKNEFIKKSNLANYIGMPSFKYSLIIDDLYYEVNNLKTINYHIKKFETKKYDFNLIDLPGDIKYKKNLIKGMSLADAAVVIISAENENSKNNNIKDYLIIAFTIGIRQIIIAINNMDKTKDSKYSEKSFLKIQKNMNNLCKNIGFDINNIQFIPFSGFTGQNLVNKYEDQDIAKLNKMDWHKGKTLLESLDEIKPPKRSFDEPLKISIFNSIKVMGVGTVLEGKILSGKLKQGMELCLPMPNEIMKKICNSIAIKNFPINEAISGDIIGFNIKGISKYEGKLLNLV